MGMLGRRRNRNISTFFMGGDHKDLVRATVKGFFDS
jgi:hypothetical protein